MKKTLLALSIAGALVFAMRPHLSAAVEAVGRTVCEFPVGPDNPRNGEGDMIRLNDGRILLAYSRFSGKSTLDHAPATIVGRVSSDEGESWSEDFEIVGREGRQNVMSVSLLRLDEKRIAIFYARKNSDNDCMPIMRVTDDDGKSWSRPVSLLEESERDYYVVNNSRVERLKSGRIVVPLARHSMKLDGKNRFDGRLVCVFSDDNGATWKKGREYLVKDAAQKRVVVQEPGVVELKDGRLYMYARTTSGRQWQAYSRDGGETWGDFGPSPIYGPCAPATIKRLKNGDLFLVWNDHENRKDLYRRAPLVAAVSRDEGASWVCRRAVEPDEKGFFCYISVLELDGSVLLHYYNGQSLTSSRMKKIDLAEFREEPLKVLMIGNSFSICVMDYLPSVARSLGKELDIASLYIGGCSLEQHWKNVLKDSEKKAKPYLFTRNDRGRKSKRMANVCETLRSVKWDIVTVQQASSGSWRKETYSPWGDDLVAKIRELAPSAEIYVQETWSYAPWDARFRKWGIDQNRMYELLSEAYLAFASRHSLDIIPTGRAIQEWRRRLPVKYTENSFGGDVVGCGTDDEEKAFVKSKSGKWECKADACHLSNPGTYLQSLVWAGKLFSSPVPADVLRPKNLPKEKADLMIEIANDVNFSRPLPRLGEAKILEGGSYSRSVVVPRRGKARLLLPKGVGEIRSFDWESLEGGKTLASCNPGWGMTYRMVALLNETGDSYAVIQKGARFFASFLRAKVKGDGAKELVLESGYVPVEGEKFTGALPFETMIVPFRGGWFDAAEIYRKVVADEEYLKTARKRDFGRLADVGFWFWNRRTSDIVIPPIEKFMADSGVPAALDWYWWHDIPYDTGYPNFWPPREGVESFKKAVKKLNSLGIYAQTYLNGMTWDVDDASWKEGGERGARVNRKGKIYSRAWNRFSNHRLANMCGDAAQFQSRMRKTVKTIVSCGFDGQYLDMIGNGAYGACWATNHLHAPGGGNHMVLNYRRFLESIKADNPGVHLSTEDCNETYKDIFDSFILTAPSYERFSGEGEVKYEKVPVFSAIYHGAVVLFGNFATMSGIPAWDPKWPDSEKWTEEKDWPRIFPDQFPVELSRGVIWGAQPCAHNFRVEDASNPSSAPLYAFMVDTAKFYHSNRDFLFSGEMCDPGKMDCDVKTVEFLNRGTYSKKGEYAVSTHDLPVVFHSVWKNKSGEIAAVLVNWSREKRRFKLKTRDLSAEGEIPPLTWKKISPSAAR